MNRTYYSIFTSFLVFIMSVTIFSCSLYEKYNNYYFKKIEYLNFLKNQNTLKDSDVDELINLLYDEDENIRLLAIKELSNTNSEIAIKYLIKITLFDNNEKIRKYSAKSLSLIGNPAFQVLFSDLYEINHVDLYEYEYRENSTPKTINKVDKTINKVFIRIGEPCVQFLIDELKLCNFDLTRLNIIKILGKIQSLSSFQTLLELSKYDHNELIRAKALEAIGNMHRKRKVLKILSNSFNYDVSHIVKTQAIKSLLIINTPNSLRIINKMYEKAPNILNRIILLNIESDFLDKKELVTYFLKCLNDPYSSIRKSLANSSIRESAAKALGNFKTSLIANHLVNVLLHDRELTVKSTAAESLSKMKDKVEIKSLISALNSTNIFIRKEAVELLGQIGNKIAIPYLVKQIECCNYPISCGVPTDEFNNFILPERSLWKIKRKKYKQIICRALINIGETKYYKYLDEVEQFKYLDISELIFKLNSGDFKKYEAALIFNLGKRGSLEAVNHIIKIMEKDKYSRFFDNGVMALGNIICVKRTPKAVRLLYNCFSGWHSVISSK